MLSSSLKVITSRINANNVNYFNCFVAIYAIHKFQKVESLLEHQIGKVLGNIGQIMENIASILGQLNIFFFGIMQYYYL